jgi:superfamily II DNA or RNA helicase
MPLASLELLTDYRTAQGDPVADFYVPCLERAERYTRASGYFRSSVMLLIGDAYVAFARRGGTATIICSPDLEESDLKAIELGLETQEALIGRRILQDVESLLATASLEKGTKILATLIASGCLTLRIAYRPGHRGIYHEKIGCFEDTSGRVTFIGSANETHNAWAASGNFESIEVFCSWHSSRDVERTTRHTNYLRDLSENRVPGVAVIDFPEAARRRLFERAAGSLDELAAIDAPVQTGSRAPLPHQVKSIESWNAAERRGILQHATGSGKTFTALLAVSEHCNRGLPALILVPSVLLQQQWRQEVSSTLADAVILLAGGGHDRWREGSALRAQTSHSHHPVARVTIATMATASSKEFRAKIEQGKHLLVVADEVHQLGSPENARFLEVVAGAKLGLSATPQRYGDPVGTSALFEFFGGILEPVITLKDAIDAGRLVPYDYYPVGVMLTDDEAEAWRALSKRISTLIGDSKQLPDEAKRLLIRRSRIAKKAERKIDAVRQIVKREFRENQRWIIYCEDIEHMTDVQSCLFNDGIESTLYHSRMSADPKATLRWFTERGGILVSVRCLDEGVDIPNVTHAVIVASSQNPRQFVQRRGRVLRAHPTKRHATLHDVLVLPVSDDDDPLRSLEAEFVRAVQFAKDSRNEEAHANLARLATDASVDLTSHYAEEEGDLDE